MSCVSQYLNECCYTINPPCSVEVLSDVSHALRCPLPIFSNPLRLPLCVSMCLDKTASSCTNWNRWHKLQGRVNKLHLHGNTCWQMCPLTSLQRYMGIAACTRVKPFGKTEGRRNQPQIGRGRFLLSKLSVAFLEMESNTKAVVHPQSTLNDMCLVRRRRKKRREAWKFFLISLRCNLWKKVQVQCNLCKLITVW